MAGMCALPLRQKPRRHQQAAERSSLRTSVTHLSQDMGNTRVARSIWRREDATLDRVSWILLDRNRERPIL